MNLLKRGTLAVGAPGSSERRKAEIEDLAKNSDIVRRAEEVCVQAATSAEPAWRIVARALAAERDQAAQEIEIINRLYPEEAKKRSVPEYLQFIADRVRDPD